MLIVKIIGFLAAGGVVAFGILRLTSRTKQTPIESALAPSPLLFAGQLSLAIMLLCGAIETEARWGESVQGILLAGVSLFGFVSAGFAYRKLYSRKKTNNSRHPTPTSRPVSMIPRNYNLNPVSGADSC